MTHHNKRKWLGSLWRASIFVAGLLVVSFLGTPTQSSHAENERIITVYHDGIEKTIVTDAKTVGEALERADVALHKNDSVEPSVDMPLVARGYSINVYRARPVTVVDGNRRLTVLTAHTSAREIAEAAGAALYDEDYHSLDRIDDFVEEGGAGLKLTIKRATVMRLVLYGKPAEIRTQAKTIGELMQEKHIVLQSEDGANLSTDVPITSSTIFEVWRQGAQTLTLEQDVAFSTETIRDTSKPLGFREIKEPGKNGKKLVTYEVEMRNGLEVARKEIQSVVTEQPSKQVEIVGSKPGDGLTKSKGVNYFVDSNGVRHRETYYDLKMDIVMRYCGGGAYNVREDGAKVDKDGYILVAANLNRYPRCSVVETSLGLGKVYDTGGFASVHPDGFDLATDWSNYDGR